MLPSCSNPIAAGQVITSLSINGIYEYCYFRFLIETQKIHQYYNGIVHTQLDIEEPKEGRNAKETVEEENMTKLCYVVTREPKEEKDEDSKVHKVLAAEDIVLAAEDQALATEVQQVVAAEDQILVAEDQALATEVQQVVAAEVLVL